MIQVIEPDFEIHIGIKLDKNKNSVVKVDWSEMDMKNIDKKEIYRKVKKYLKEALKMMG